MGRRVGGFEEGIEGKEDMRREERGRVIRKEKELKMGKRDDKGDLKREDKWERRYDE
jgi:hypothetical protein